MIKLTELETKAMSVKNTDYDSMLDGKPTWAFAWMDETGIPENQVRGVMSSLIKKGLIVVEDDGDEPTIYYTEEGIKVNSELNN